MGVLGRRGRFCRGPGEDSLERGRKLRPGFAALGRASVVEMDRGRERVRPVLLGEIILDDEIRAGALEERPGPRDAPVPVLRPRSA